MTRPTSRKTRVVIVLFGIAFGWICQEAMADYLICDALVFGNCSGTGKDLFGCFSSSATACVATAHKVSFCNTGLGTCGSFGNSYCTGTCVGSGYACSVTGMAGPCTN